VSLPLFGKLLCMCVCVCARVYTHTHTETYTCMFIIYSIYKRHTYIYKHVDIIVKMRIYKNMYKYFPVFFLSLSPSFFLFISWVPWYIHNMASIILEISLVKLSTFWIKNLFISRINTKTVKFALEANKKRIKIFFN